MKSKRNIHLLYAIAFLQGMVFYAPIASLYRQAAGLTLGQIALIEGISYIISLAMELPWGILADRIGYRKTMIVCCGFYFLSKIIFWQAAGFGAFLLERFALSIALSGLSGVDESMLYLSCPINDSQRVFGLYDAYGTAGMLLASLAYLFFIGENYHLAALATVIAYGAAALLSLGLVEVRPPEKERRSALSGFLYLMKQTLHKPTLLVFIAGFAIFQEAVQMVTVWLNQNQYLRCGMNGAAMAISYILVSLAMLSGAHSKQLTDRIGSRRLCISALVVSAGSCILLVFTRSALLSVLCISAAAAARATLAPLVSATYNQHVTSSDRATQLSIFALFQNCTAAGAQVLYGRAADFSLNAAFLVCALACIIACATLLPLLGWKAETT